jgi:hypothetical protein
MSSHDITLDFFEYLSVTAFSNSQKDAITVNDNVTKSRVID